MAQGLKPIDSIDLIGMTEVMPFYKGPRLKPVFLCAVFRGMNALAPSGSFLIQ